MGKWVQVGLSTNEFKRNLEYICGNCRATYRLIPGQEAFAEECLPPEQVEGFKRMLHEGAWNARDAFDKTLLYLGDHLNELRVEYARKCDQGVCCFSIMVNGNL